MSESSHEFLGNGSAKDDQFITSWARISLDYGQAGFDLADLQPEPEEAGEPADRLRLEIEQMIGMIRQAGQDTEHDSKEVVDQDDPLLARIKGMDLSVDLLEKMLTQQIKETGSIPEAERLEENSLSLDLELDTDDVSTVNLPTVEQEESISASEPAPDDLNDLHSADQDLDLTSEFDQRVREATSDDVVQSLLLASLDLPEVLVYESDEQHVDVYVLCIQEDDQLLTARLNDQGKLETGIDFEEFASELMSELPTRGGLCAGEDSYRYSAPVTVLGEELSLDADSRIAALIELELPEVPLLVADTLVATPVGAVPADNGWSLISTDPVSMLNLLQKLAKPAIVAESNGVNHHLSFIVPGQSAQPAQSSQPARSQWMHRVVGDPNPKSTDSGAVIDLVWGAPKTITRYLPQNSYALETLWALPGVLPDPLNYVRINDEIENLTWVYGLDESTAKRLRNYVESSDSELGMESVLQLLALPDELAKIALGTLDLETLNGYRVFTPDMSLGRAMTESALAYPNGRDSFSALNRELIERPWIFAVDGMVQLTASSALALWAARRKARGDSSKVAAMGAVALLGSGVTELALSRAYRKLKDLYRGGSSAQDEHKTEQKGQQASLMDELGFSAERAQAHTPRHLDEHRPPAALAAEDIKQFVSDIAQKFSKRFRKG